MSEQNVLNPTQTSLFNPDWGYTEGLPELRSVFQAQSGNIYSRLQQGLGRIYDLGWNGRDLATKLAFQQWENQYRDDYFTLADYDSGRYFTGRFDSPLSYSPRGNAQYDIKGRFIELPGKPMFAYPSNWNRDAIFLEDRNSAGETLAKLTGTWASDTNAAYHGGTAYLSQTTNDTAEWVYFGYGFQVWSAKAAANGIVNLFVFRVRDGVGVSGGNLFDLYNASTVPSAPYQTVVNLPLDFYRVVLTVTGTKNVAASNFFCEADAVQVMR